MITALWIIFFIAVLLVLLYKHASVAVFTIGIGVYLLLLTKFSAASGFALSLTWFAFAVVAVFLNVKPIRQLLFTRHILHAFTRSMPSMSDTERTALDAGTVKWSGEVFGGAPNWKTLLAYPKPVLSQEEQAFLAGPVEELCKMTDDWDITHNKHDVPENIWAFLRKHGFFGMIIPKSYGGLEFSALAHSAVIIKISGRSVSVATVMSVPNSLGPAELLLEYGTEEQKNYYLPRLASGEDIPCFALTGPEVGSDAGAMPDHGIVCRGKFEGQETVGIRVNWDKRYITLAPVATLLGVAFKLFDPDHLLSDKEDWGITCALIPAKTKGVTTGRRHFPLNSAFPNGPTQGKDVFIPLDWIIGGPKMAGHGWRMLVESLSAGRAISLPSTVTAGAKIAVYAVGAYTHIRKQFNMPIGQFEGVQEALARIGGHAYIMDAMRVFVVGLVDQGEKPSVPSAISKYHCTELGRKVVNDAMDIYGGKGIQLGPRNSIGRGYQEAPIAITVEGANILTRSMVIFGQGAMRCHPYVFKEMQAAIDKDLPAFDKAFIAHIGHIFSNKTRATVLGLTNGYFAGAPKSKAKRYYQHVMRFSAAFAYVADVSMIVCGASLKRREHLSARLGDVLSMLYMTTAVLKHFRDQGELQEDFAIVEWACQSLLFHAQTQLDGILRNFPNRFAATVMRAVIFPLGRRLTVPSDKLSKKVAMLLFNPTEARSRLSDGAYLTPDKENRVGMIGVALEKILAAEELEKRLHIAGKEGKLEGIYHADKIASALKIGLIDTTEEKILLAAHEARTEVIAVDDFTLDEICGRGVAPKKAKEPMKAKVS